MATPYVTTKRRRLVSLFIGAGTGGFLTLIGFMLTPDFRAALLANPVVPLGIILTWIIFSVPFLIGISLVAPVWRRAERGHVLGWKAAGFWGALVGLPFSLAPFVALLSSFLRKYGPSISVTAVSFPPLLLVFAVACPVIGCLVGLATWRFAYRRQSAGAVSEIFS